MPIFVNHNVDPPTTHDCAPDACVAIGELRLPGCIPVNSLPVGIYLDGGNAGSIPEGYTPVSSQRLVRGGVSCVYRTYTRIIDPKVAEAQQIMTDPDAVDAVQQVLARVTEVAMLGVDITDWSFQGVTAAAELAAKNTETPTRLDILTASVALLTSWSRIIYHAGNTKQADLIWPYLVDELTRLMSPPAEVPADVLADIIPPEDPPIVVDPPPAE